jgi:2-oxoisovalerate dehydrogenase E1 component beta subunit
MANMAQAIRMALHIGEENLGVKDIFGQDVGAPLGGVFTATQGLKTTWNSPLDERGIVGCAMGIALTGDRCVAEIQFCDYIFNTIDLLKIAGNTLWVSHGNYNMPLVLMTPVGAGIRGSIYHSHSFDAWATRLPGWKIVMPSTPLDAYGLMLSAIEDPNPVLYLKPKALLRVRGEELLPGEPADEKELKAMIDAPLGDRSKWKPKWPALDANYRVPIGQAKICREGDAATVVSYGRTLLMCVKAADELRAEMGAQIEVIDLRSLYPYDWQCLKKSISKTRRVLFVNEDTDVTNFGEHLAYRATNELFYELYASPRVLAGKNLPGIGLHPHYEDASVPQYREIVDNLRELVTEVP